MTRPVITPPAAQPNTVQNDDQITQEQRSQAYNADAYDYNSGYDVADIDYNAFMPEQKSLHTAAAGTTSKPRNNKSIQIAEKDTTADTATTAAQAQATTATASRNTTNTVIDTGLNDQFMASDQTSLEQNNDQEKIKQALIELQKFMIETKETSNREKVIAERECRAALGI